VPQVLGPGSAQATRTVVLVGPTLLLPSVPAKVVLKALSTREDGSAAATSAAAEPSGDTTSESKVSKFSGLVMSTMVFPGQMLAVFVDDVV
jgi:hypothetical protein